MMTTVSLKLIYLIDVFLVWLSIQVQSKHMFRRCEADINAVSYQGCVKIEPVEGSRVQFDSLAREFGDGSSLQVQFRTSRAFGLIFYATRRNDDESLVAIHIHKGYLRYTFKCRYGSASLTYTKGKVNDNRWHTLDFRLVSRTGVVEIDGEKAFRDYYISCPGFTTIVFGGIKPSHFGSYSVRSLRRTQLDGYIRRAKISTRWTKPPRYYKVSSCKKE